MNKLQQWIEFGQSYWLDNLTRKKITSGELKKRVAEQGLRGITSNPSIFNKAITNSNDYDEQIKVLVNEGCGAQQIYEALTVKDVQEACDILRPVYDESNGTDGFVSLEVSPYLARDTEGTMQEARRLYKAVNRLNCLIKIPGTKEGIPAIEAMLYEGINVNVTLLFSIERYAEVAHAYVRALQRRHAGGKSIKNVISVASFFLSRIDVLTDELLGHHIISEKTKGNAPRPELLIGETGISSARLAYQRFKEIFSGAEWDKLKNQGAHVQRPLWASTSTKDPLYSDIRYVETLIAPDTVNTLPDETIAAFADHGQLKKNTIGEHLAEAQKVFSDLKKLEIDIDFITQQLENEGIQKFIDPYDKLMNTLAKKRLEILDHQVSSQYIGYGDLDREMAGVFTSLDEKQVGRRLFDRDPYLWKSDNEQVKAIRERLGWLSLPNDFAEKVSAIQAFAKTIKEEDYRHTVVLGMGGSSLCSEVARETFDAASGYPKLLVLDNTSPAAIRQIEQQIDPAKTLFIVASKSGTTTETISFFKYFYQKLTDKKVENPSKHFIAITDDDTPLMKIATDHHFRQVFINPADVGGRYSVLSYFGLVPMALMGIDIQAIIKSAQQMQTSCDPYVPATTNPGLSLGATLGFAQRRGRDKVTFALSPSVRAFGLWVEQLIAESTGKDGTGLIPVEGETLGKPAVYDNNRVFVHLFVAGDKTDETEQQLAALEKAGHPVVRIKLPDKQALGGEFYRWEIATAIAGMILNVNAFDEPNVAESKRNSRELLKAWQQNGSFQIADPLIKNGDVAVYGGKKVAKVADQHHESVGDMVNSFTALAKAHDYIALLPYFNHTKDRAKLLQTWRHQLRDELHVATTLRQGPRYLHSTGQLHKGGPNSGLYILLTGKEGEALPIPDEKYDFMTLQEAQVLGDFRSLDDHGRRVIRIDLGKDIDRGLQQLWQSIKEEHKHFV